MTVTMMMIVIDGTLDLNSEQFHRNHCWYWIQMRSRYEGVLQLKTGKFICQNIGFTRDTFSFKNVLRVRDLSTRWRTSFIRVYLKFIFLYPMVMYANFLFRIFLIFSQTMLKKVNSSFSLHFFLTETHNVLTPFVNFYEQMITSYQKFFSLSYCPTFLSE